MKLEIDVSCPECKKSFKQKVGEMLPGKSRACPHCRAKITYSGDGGRKAQKAIDDFERDLKKLGFR